MNVTELNSVKRPRPVVLCILDGWGYREETKDNAVALANTPVWDELYATYPTGFLKACGLDVGLPEGQMGNSEVGHMNLGAGRVVMQELPKIDEAVKTGSIANTDAVKKIIGRWGSFPSGPYGSLGKDYCACWDSSQNPCVS